MSRQSLVALGVVVGAIVIAAVGLGIWEIRQRQVGWAEGELSFRGHSGSFQLVPEYCRRAVTGRGAGIYNHATPALAFGYFNDLDGGEWVEARGPGVLGATRFDPEDCAIFDAKTALDRGLTSGHVEVVCDSKDSPGVAHIEGEVTFHRCGDGDAP